MFFILCLVFPWIIGTLILPDREQAFCTAAYRIIGGNTGMWAVFQLLAVPAVLLQVPFHTLVRLWTGALLLLLGLFAIFCRNPAFRRKAFFMRRTAAEDAAEKEPLPAGNRVTLCLLILASLILIGGQCRRYLFEEHIDDDDSRFIASAVSAYQHDTMLLENPATGEVKPRPEGELVKDAASPWPMYLAALSALANVHPAITAHTVLPAYLLLLRYLVIWCVGSALFAEGKSRKAQPPSSEKQAWFLLFSAAALQFFGGSVHTAGAFALTRIWQGKAVLAAVMIPWILLLTYGSEWTGEALSAKALIAASAAACLLSGMGILMAGALTGSYALWKALTERRLSSAALPLLCALPCLAYGLVYMILR